MDGRVIVLGLQRIHSIGCVKQYPKFGPAALWKLRTDADHSPS